MMKTGDRKPKTIAGRVREAAQALGTFSIKDLVNLVNYDYRHSIPRIRVRTTVMDFRKRGEIKRIRQDEYKYISRPNVRTKLDVIWHLVRSHRRFSTDDMETFSGAKRATVLEYLRCLRRLGYIKQISRGHWQMINDPGPETPVNTAKCVRLKRAYRTRKEKGGGL
jgi:hypothetical protein